MRTVGLPQPSGMPAALLAAALLLSLLLCAHPAAAQVCTVNITSPPASYTPLTYSDAMLLLSTLNTARNNIRLAAAMPLLQWSGALANYVSARILPASGGACQLPAVPAANIGGFASVNFAAVQGAAGASVAALAPTLTAGASSYTYVPSRQCPSAGWCGQCAAGTNSPCMLYTQAVWAASTVVGCSTALCGGSQVLVCGFGPAGNIAGQAPYAAATTPLVGCQYPAAGTDDGQSKLIKIGSIVGGILLFLVGGVGYFCMDGGGCGGGADNAKRRPTDGGGAVLTAAERRANAMDVPLASAQV